MTYKQQLIKKIVDHKIEKWIESGFSGDIQTTKKSLERAEYRYSKIENLEKRIGNLGL